MNSRTLPITSELRLFLRDVLKSLDPNAEGLQLHGGCASATRSAGSDVISLTWFPPEKGVRWVFDATEPQLRELASGRVTEVVARRRTLVVPRRRPASGAALLVWGPGATDLLDIPSEHALAQALEALGTEALELGPRAFRLWSRCDDLLQGVLQGDSVAFQVAWSDGKHGTSIGNEVQLETLPARGADGDTIEVYWCDFLPQEQILPRLVAFAQQGELADIPVSERIDPRLLDKAQRRREGDRGDRSALPDLANTSLAAWVGRPRKANAEDHETRAHQLLVRLLEGELLALEDGVSATDLEEPLAHLLEEHGPLSSDEQADALADALSELPGVDDAFLSGEDLRRILNGIR